MNDFLIVGMRAVVCQISTSFKSQNTKLLDVNNMPLVTLLSRYDNPIKVEIGREKYLSKPGMSLLLFTSIIVYDPRIVLL